MNYLWRLMPNTLVVSDLFLGDIMFIEMESVGFEGLDPEQEAQAQELANAHNVIKIVLDNQAVYEGINEHQRKTTVMLDELMRFQKRTGQFLLKPSKVAEDLSLKARRNNPVLDLFDSLADDIPVLGVLYEEPETILEVSNLTSDRTPVLADPEAIMQKTYYESMINFIADSIAIPIRNGAYELCMGLVSIATKAYEALNYIWQNASIVPPSEATILTPEDFARLAAVSKIVAKAQHRASAETENRGTESVADYYRLLEGNITKAYLDASDANNENVFLFLESMQNDIAYLRSVGFDNPAHAKIRVEIESLIDILEENHGVQIRPLEGEVPAFEQMIERDKGFVADPLGTADVKEEIQQLRDHIRDIQDEVTGGVLDLEVGNVEIKEARKDIDELQEHLDNLKRQQRELEYRTEKRSIGFSKDFGGARRGTEEDVEPISPRSRPGIE